MALKKSFMGAMIIACVFVHAGCSSQKEIQIPISYTQENKIIVVKYIDVTSDITYASLDMFFGRKYDIVIVGVNPDERNKIIFVGIQDEALYKLEYKIANRMLRINSIHRIGNDLRISARTNWEVLIDIVAFF